MLSASSPVVYPPSSSPPNPKAKRPNPHHNPKPPRARTKAGFLVDDSSDDENDDGPVEPTPKRRMLSSPSDFPGVELTEPSSPPPPPPPPSGPSNKEPEDLPSSSHQPDLRLQPEPQNNTSESQNSNAGLGSLFASSTTASVLDRLVTRQPQATFKITTCSGRDVQIKQRKKADILSYQNIVAARSKTKEGRAKRSYYGIDIHQLVEGISKDSASKNNGSNPPGSDAPMPSVEGAQNGRKPKKCMLWTEKYRAKNFVDLVGDDYTNRQVLRWLKRWDPLVFPKAAKSKPVIKRSASKQQDEEEKPHRKILMLTGAPGLGKTTLAHVCAIQAGYDVMEINASDDRSKDVVKNRIRTALGTETVKTVQHARQQPGQQQKVARPACVVVDEVDGVITGSGGSGEGGFIKALMDLITVGEKNALGQGATQHSNRKKKGDDFRQMRPLILICNDMYHPSLRPLRQSNLAEVIHVGKPTIDAVVTRLKTVFEREGIPCEKDAARKLCEAAWGMTSGIDAKRGAESTAEGDLRGVMVVGEWVAGRVRSASSAGSLSLTRQWVERNIVHDLAHGGGGARGLGRGNIRDIVARVFQEGAGFPKTSIIVAAPSAKTRGEQPKAQLGFTEQQKKYATERLTHMIETSGDVDRILTDVMSEYPNHEFNDDSFLSKPNQAYEWMYFHDVLSSKLYGSQDWELAPYLSQPVLACHHLFASPMSLGNMRYDRKWGEDEEGAPPLPFSGPRAAFVAHETQKENRAMLQAIQAQLPPTLMRAFRSPEDVATDFLPYLIRLVSPNVKPVVVGGGGSSTASVRKDTEKAMVKRAAEVMADVGIVLQRGKIENDSAFTRGPQWVYRMEPDLDVLATYETSAAVIHGTQAPTRFAVRQVLDQELQKTKVLRESAARQARLHAGIGNLNGAAGHPILNVNEREDSATAKASRTQVLPIARVKKDFFGRIIKTEAHDLLQERDGGGGSRKRKPGEEPLGTADATKVWVTFHEGLNNAVRKPLSLDEFMRGL